METRECSACKQELLISEFTKDRRRASGIAGRCKPCKADADWRRNGTGTPDQNWTQPDLNVLSLGAGVQSSAVLLMSCLGDLPKLDAAIFADTGWDPPETYDWLNLVLEPAARKARIPLTVVSAGNIRASVSFISLPAYTRHGGKVGMLRRQCTREFKIAPVRSELYRLSRNGTRNVSQWFGISADEISRMSTSDVLYIRNDYPLVDRGIDRASCQEWLVNHGYGRAPRSACVGCPYHSDSEWAGMKADQPVLFRQAADFEREMQTAEGHDETFLHRSCVALDEVVFEERSAAGEECGGYCFV